MSYTPGTKLSHTDATRRATVLTGDNVMVTGGLGYGQMMKLADWLILADGARIQEEFIPVPKDGAVAPLPAASAARNRLQVPLGSERRDLPRGHYDREGPSPG